MGKCLSKEISDLSEMKMKSLKEKVLLRDPLHLVIAYVPGIAGSGFEDPESNPYIKGIKSDCSALGIKCTVAIAYTKDVLSALCSSVGSLYMDKDAVIVVQSPINPIIPKDKIKITVRRSMAPYYDIDAALGVNSYYISPVASAIVEFMEHITLFNSLADTNVAIINRSDHIGKPLAELLLAKDANPIVLHSKTSSFNIISLCGEARFIITATGNSSLINKNFLGCISAIGGYKTIIDVGNVYDDRGNFCGGDIDKSLYPLFEKEKYNKLTYTPCIGGIGKITRLCLLDNLINGYTLVG